MCKPIRPMSQSVRRPFHFDWSRNGCHVQVDAEIEIPLHEDQSVTKLHAQLVANSKVPCFVQNDLKIQLAQFIQQETDRCFDEDGDRAVEALLRGEGDDDAAWVSAFSSQYKQFAQAPSFSADDSFSAVFQELFRESVPSTIDTILNRERQLADEVQKIVRARDWEVERLKRDHAGVIEKVVHDLNSADNDQQVSMAASRHFEKIHMVESNYASQLSSIMNSQQREFRSMVVRLHEDQVLRAQGLPGRSIESLNFVKSDDAGRQKTVRASGDQPTQSSNLREESFTIYLGAQLKTMHNLRLLACDPIELLCRCRPHSTVEDSRRLEMSLSLYGYNLSAAVLLVDSRHSFHTNFHTEFAKCCEQSTELHFQLLDTQLSNVAKATMNANVVRSTQKGDDASASLHSSSSFSSNETLATGDVYLSRHSNLARVQLAFHLVADEALRSQDISSRHPCINGLRNIVRVSAKFGIGTISIPLLLVDKMTEEMTVQWCIKRAELVFKCVKGFLMEACSLDSSAPGGDHSRHTHFNVQFLVPAEISAQVYSQITEMLPTIFHLVNPVVAD
uniref:Uncharacterized protein n=1 Tax=Plectus sambesii TaxID=2011161 RepID=A0A914UM41_9BILA